MAFDGTLLKMGTDVFPLRFVYADSYKITPNRRQDLDPDTDANGVLHRNVVSHMPSTIAFTAKPMKNAELAEMMAFIRNHYTNTAEKKLNLTYYCPDLDGYQTGEFYLDPNVEFPINYVDSTKKVIQYGSFELNFVEY